MRLQFFRKEECGMANERLTEAIVRDHFKNDPLFSSIRLSLSKWNSLTAL